MKELYVITATYLIKGHWVEKQLFSFFDKNLAEEKCEELNKELKQKAQYEETIGRTTWYCFNCMSEISSERYFVNVVPIIESSSDFDKEKNSLINNGCFV